MFVDFLQPNGYSVFKCSLLSSLVQQWHQPCVYWMQPVRPYPPLAVVTLQPSDFNIYLLRNAMNFSWILSLSNLTCHSSLNLNPKTSLGTTPPPPTSKSLFPPSNPNLHTRRLLKGCLCERTRTTGSDGVIVGITLHPGLGRDRLD